MLVIEGYSAYRAVNTLQFAEYHITTNALTIYNKILVYNGCIKTLKTLHVSIHFKIIFRELVLFLVKVTD